MAQLSDLQAALDQIKTGVAGLSARIAALEAQVSSAPPVTQDQLDAVTAEAAAIAASLPTP